MINHSNSFYHLPPLSSFSLSSRTHTHTHTHTHFTCFIRWCKVVLFLTLQDGIFQGWKSQEQIERWWCDAVGAQRWRSHYEQTNKQCQPAQWHRHNHSACEYKYAKKQSAGTPIGEAHQRSNALRPNRRVVHRMLGHQQHQNQ